MTKNLMVRGMFLAAALAFSACGGGGAKKCNTNADCATGETCNVSTGTCQTAASDGGTGGGTGGGSTGGGTGGGSTGGGTGGGSTGGGTGGGSTGGGTGGGSTGGGTGGGSGGGGGSTGGGESCDMAIALTSGQALTGQDTTGATSDYDGTGTSCEGSAAGDRVYSITVPAGELLTVTVTPGSAFDPTLSVAADAASCATQCLGAKDVGADGDPETFTKLNDTGAAATVYLIVDGYSGSEGTFDIVATTAAPPAGDSCATATALTAGTPATAQALTGFSNDYPSVTGCRHTSQPERAYKVTVPAGKQVAVTVTPEGTSDLDLTLNLVENAGQCGVACLKAEDVGYDGDPETLVYTNASATAQEYLVVVDQYSGGTGTFSITYTTQDPPADDTCATPTTVAEGTPLTGQTTVGYANDYQSDKTAVACNSPGGFSSTADTGSDRVYSLTVPAGKRGTLTATPAASSGFNPSLTFVANAAACTASPRACLTAVDNASADQPESLRVYNTGSAPQTYLAIVDSSGAAGGFDLALTTATPAADDTCTTNATALTSGVAVTGSLAGMTNDYGTASTNCFTFQGPDRVYKATVQAGQKLNAVVTPTGSADGGMDTVISLVTGTASNCEALPRTCAGGADFNYTAGVGETAAYTNTTSAAMDVFVVVADYEAASTDTAFSLTATMAAAPAGEHCANAEVVTATKAFAAETLVGASPDVKFDEASTTCLVANGLPDRLYSVTVGAGQTLTAVITPPTDGNVGLNLFEGPSCTAVATCLAKVNDDGAGVAETLTWQNTGTAAKTVFLQAVGIPPSTYSLNITLQ